MIKGVTCLMPEQCSKCGELFDLSYDLEREGFVNKEAIVVEIVGKMARRREERRKHLCWRCRGN